MKQSIAIINGILFNKQKSWIKDPRDFQIVYLSLFLVYGILMLSWDAAVADYAIIIGTCLATQTICIGLTTKNFTSLKSALITALGLCLILKANSQYTLAFASFVAIASKFTLRFNNKHLFNPANFGIIIAVLFTNDAWFSPGQWGSNEAMQIYFIGALALILLLRVQRLDTSIAFLGTFVLLEYCRTVAYQGWEMEVLIERVTNGSLLLFTFFMITDPVTTPNAPKARIIWACSIAFITFLMTNWFQVHTAPLWVLFVLSPLTVLLDKHFVHEQFKWKK